jgi:hypothetical protein
MLYNSKEIVEDADKCKISLVVLAQKYCEMG